MSIKAEMGEGAKNQNKQKLKQDPATLSSRYTLFIFTIF